MVYVFLAQGFEIVEALAPVDILRRAKIEVKTVGVTGKTVVSSNGIPVTADITTDEMKLDSSLELIVLPGGMPGANNLEADSFVQSAIDFCVENGKYVSAICAAPKIIGHKGLLSETTRKKSIIEALAVILQSVPTEPASSAALDQFAGYAHAFLHAVSTFALIENDS